MAKKSLADMNLEELGNLEVIPYKKSESWFSRIKKWYGKGKKSKPKGRHPMNPDTSTRRELKRSGLSDKDINDLGIT